MTVIKQVLVVRNDLGMRKGKIGSQCAHASMKVFFDRGNIQEDYLGFSNLQIEINEDMSKWIAGAFTKVVLKVESSEEFFDIYNKAVDAELPCAYIVDNGTTVFDGVKTPTVLAIGPAKSELIDVITSHLKLL